MDDKNFNPPKLTFSHIGWSEKHGSGFTVGHLRQLGNNEMEAAIKLCDVCNYLAEDPYDKTHTRLRVFGTATLIDKGEDSKVIFSKSQVHQQAENPEFPNKKRVLPSLPNEDLYTDDIITMIKSTYQFCKPRGFYPTHGMKVNTHFIRLQPTEFNDAHATPPIMHRDNSRWIFLLLLNRSNVDGGVNVIYNNSKEEVVRFELLPFQFFAVDDRRFYHFVDTVILSNECENGFRDVLLIELTELVPEDLEIL